MSDSDDPRFRIPRGSSDEEIDSDLASITSDPPAAIPTARTDRAAIAAAATTLRSQQSVQEPVDSAIMGPAMEEEGGSDADDEADDAALTAVTFAATGRRDLSREGVRRAREVMEAGEEVEGIVPVVGGGREGGAQQEMMGRMLSVLGEGEVGGLGELKKKVARLGGRRPLNVPLERPVADRISRSVVYGEMKEEVTERWGQVVAENRRKRHLSFPLNGEGIGKGRNSGNVVEGFKPENEYEKEIQSMLREAGVANDNAAMKEEEKGLGEMKVSKQEIMERRREMAKVRSMMFHYEQKMKRIAKIKSRKYRRILKKEKEKIREMDRPENWEEEELVEKERRRAEERMTLRHKNTSKWVRRQLTRGEGKRNENTRAAIEDQLRLHEKLKERQERLMDESEESDSDESVGDGATEQRIEEELQKIREEIEEDGREPEREKRQKRKGLMGMRFMQAAEERQRKKAKELLDQMNDEGIESGDDEKVEPDNRKGRRTFSGRETEGKKINGKNRQSGKKDVLGKDHEEVDYSLSEGEEGDVALLKERISVKQKGVEEEREDEEFMGMFGHEGFGNGSLGEALRNGGQVRNGFTTRLQGRLKADDPSSGRYAEGKENSEGSGEDTGDGGAEEKRELKASKEDSVDGEDEEDSSEGRDKGSRGAEDEVMKSRGESCGGEAIAEVGKDSDNDEYTEEELKGMVVGGQDRTSVGTKQAQVKGKKKGGREKGSRSSDGKLKAENEDEGQSGGEMKGSKRKARRKKGRKVKFSEEMEVKKTTETEGAVGDEGKMGKDAENKQGSREEKKRSGKGLGVRHERKLGEDGEKRGCSEEKKKTGNGVGVRDEWKIGEDEDGQESIEDEEVSKMRFVAEAFAGAGGADEEEFAALKREEVEREAPTAKSIGAEVLPGWGRWDGAGMKKNGKGKRGREREESAFAKAARERLAAAREKAVKGRRDSGLDHVILEERRVKRAAELTMASVPFPFRSAEEWGREVEVPVCREFVSGRGFGNGVRARVEKRAGAVIEPIRIGTSRERRESRKRKREEEVREMVEGRKGVLEMRKRKARERDMGRRGLMVGK